MKGSISELMAGTAFLIGLYLFLHNGKQTVDVIKSLGTAYTSGVKALQGRE